MKKHLLLAGLCISAFFTGAFAQNIVAGRMNEVFLKSTVSSSGLTTPWEITYGPDGYLWVTDAKAYKVFRINLSTNVKTQILDLSDVGSFTPASFKRTFSSSQNPWPQGGLAGLAIHPDFMNPVTPKKYVYISYVRKYDSASVTTNGGYFFKNSVVRFTYNTGTGLLESPIAICDTLPGSSDHNSQRIIIIPVNGVNYLMYASGDMGAGQLSSTKRVNRAQDLTSYQGKILRFNLEPDADAGAYDQWIPNDNPYNGASQSAIWCTGVRNNQGFAYDSVRNILYGSSHGPYSDDEVNIIDSLKNYGHPDVIGKASDENYANSNAGANSGSTLPIITSEVANANAIGFRYRDPLFTGYPTDQTTIHNIWVTNPGNNTWPSEAWSGLGLYNYSAIPGWKNSLLLAGLKWGRLIRLKLDANGTATYPSNATSDTVINFDGTPRYRDMAISPDGRDIYIAYDNSNSGAAPTGSNNPSLPACLSCIQKFTFLGYNTSGGTSSIPTSIAIAPGIANVCQNANNITIDATNNTLWVPITDTSGNIVAEINANGNNLGIVTTSLYTKSGAVRETNTSHTLYLNRNLTITPQTQPSTAVSVRLYLTNAEFNSLKTATNSLSQPSGVNTPTDLAIFKNSDAGCPTVMGIIASPISTTNQAAFGATGYVVQANINSFSTFYMANVSATLSLNLISFTGTLSDDVAKLKWITDNEKNTSSFTIERSLNGQDFYSIGSVAANNTPGQQQYAYSDEDVSKLVSSVVYYRLKMIDIDGKYGYSQVITLNTAAGKNRISIHPNPVINNVTVDVNAAIAEKANWNITDMSGKTVLQHGVNLIKGNNTLNIDLTKLVPGTYYLKLAGNNINQAVKLQKQ